MKNLNIKKLGVFGSRSIGDERVFDEVEKYITELAAEGVIITAIVTAQEPHGVCEWAQKYAKKNAMILELHFNNTERGAGMHDRRSRDVILSADYMLFIHDGKSKGTRNEIAIATKKKKIKKYVTLSKTEIVAGEGETKTESEKEKTIYKTFKF